MKAGGYLDATPLLEWIERNPEAIEGWQLERSGPIGVAYRRISAMRNGARVSFGVADRICCLMGVHMADVFGDVYWVARLGGDGLCVGCGKECDREAERCWDCWIKVKGERAAA